MKKIKNKIILILIIITAMLSIANISKAASYTNYKIGDTLSKSYFDYVADPNLFCVQHGQSLPAWKVNYKVNSIVTIEGLQSINQADNKKITAWENGVFAYILSKDNGTESQGIDKSEGPVANALWSYLPEWGRKVGQKYNIPNGFMVGNAGESQYDYLITEAKNYATNIKENQSLEDNTNKDKIKASTVTKNGKSYIKVGPFKWTFSGKLSDISVYDQNGKAISGVIYNRYEGKELVDTKVSEIKSGKSFYALIPADKGVTEITGMSGSCKYEVKCAKIWFLENQNGTQNLIARDSYTKNDTIKENFDYNIPLLGNLKVIKIVENSEIKLSGVGFILQNKETGEYVKQNSNGTISYVSSRDEATEFITDQNGEFTVKNLLVGTYVAYETKNPNYGYEIISEGIAGSVVIDKTSELKVPNIQKYIKLSGYVWLDKISEKQAIRNDLYNDGEFDYGDKLLNGITVRLKDKSGNTIMETTTADKGAYQFVDVLVAELPNYYIEFEYDGLTFTNVVPYIDKDNGSKAAESSETRALFNNGFSSIEGTGTDTGITKDENGNKVHDLSYTKNSGEYKTKLNNVTYEDENAEVLTLANKGNYPITAETEQTGYNIIDHYVVGEEEIKNINLGLYEREQPDLALVKDLNNVNLSINGYGHTYMYEQKTREAQNGGEDLFNVGVKFGEKYSNMTYTRAIYQSDYEYTDNNSDRELKVKITYKITLKNQATDLVSQVNSVVDYYDKNYTIVAAGTDIDQSGNVLGSLNYTIDEGYSSEYNKAIIELSDSKIASQEQTQIYVQFQLNREAVARIIDEQGASAGQNNLLENVAEINSYSTFDKEGNVYAGVDVDSNPGNAVPGDTTTFEDDTDRAPALRLEVADGRKLMGKVFLDGTTPELKTGEERLGSGAYEDGELGIPGVKITLTENTGTGKVYESNTDENGDFLVAGFIPGDYTLTYTWGDETYTVQNYKGTVYSQDRYAENTQDKEWYKKDVNTRWTDAIDDYSQRQAIDEELKNITNSSQTTKVLMDSTTPTMGITVENTDMAVTDATGDELVYEIKNIDFGIVERPRQEIELVKRVSKLKVTLANGQVIEDAEFDDNGNIIKESNHVTAQPPKDTSKGFVRVEIDKELMQGSLLEVEYKITAKNNSELDYISEDYYKYGTDKDPNKLVTISPTGIIDYLDQGWAFDTENNEEQGWEQKTVEEIQQLKLVSEEVYNTDSVKGSIILYTEKLAEQNLKPTENANVTLNVSKILSVADEIYLTNYTELVEVNKTGGRDIPSTPGNYVPEGEDEIDDDQSPPVIVTPPTGQNRNFGMIIGIVVGALAVGVVGIIIIKRKVLNK